MPGDAVELDVGGRAVRISNPDKVFFAERGETKLDLARYYMAVGDGIARALYERPTQLKRPRRRGGITGDLREAGAAEPAGLARHGSRPLPLRTHADELCVTELAHVIWAVNLATLDFHPWPSRRAPKTPGNRGIHVACRIEPNWSFPEVRRCALAFAREVERRMPSLVTTAWSKEKRASACSSTTTRTPVTGRSPPPTP